MKSPMQAVILIGGKNSHRNKAAHTTSTSTADPFLLFDGRTLLEHQLYNLRRFGFQDYLLLTDGAPGPFLQHYGPGSAFASESGACVSVVSVPSPISSGSALKATADLLHEKFLFLYGDTLFDFNYLDLVNCSYEEEPTDWLGRIALTSAAGSSRHSLVTLEEGRVTALQAPITASEPGLANSGVYWLRSQLLELVEDSCGSLEQDVFPHLIASGRLIGRCYPGLYLNPGFTEDMNIANKELLDRLRKPAAFLDRDGTLNHDAGYIYRIEDFHWLDGAKAAIKKLNDAGYLVFLVSNQSGIARGYYDSTAVERLHQWMQDDLAASGAHIDDIRYCPHHPEGKVPELTASCDCRKPEPGMLHDLIRRWQPDLEKSFMLGDAGRDAQAGQAAGITAKKISPGSILQEVTLMIGDQPDV